jgi:hypothetical protein
LSESVDENMIYDIYHETCYDNFDLCYEKFEETAFMAKAPVDPVNEHINNLSSILDIHSYFMKNYGSVDPSVILEKKFC